MNNPLAVDYDFALNYLESHLDKRQVNKIQHAFPSPRFWTETDIPVPQVRADRQKLHSQGAGMPVNLYVGVPYCIQTDPGKCGYCLFPVEVFTGNIDLEVYFGYLKREAARYKDALNGVPLGAVFFGGGTSNLYKEDKYFALMDLVRDLFPVNPSYVDITLEGIPQLFNREGEGDQRRWHEPDQHGSTASQRAPEQPQWTQAENKACHPDPGVGLLRYIKDTL